MLGDKHCQLRHALLRAKLPRLLGGRGRQLLVALQAGQRGAHPGAAGHGQRLAHLLPLRHAVQREGGGG